MKSSRLFGALTTLALTLYTAFVLLDAFVIPRAAVQQPEAVSSPQSVSPAVAAPAADSSDVTQTDSLYRDSNIEINITTRNEYDSTIYVADVKLADASLLKTAFAENTFGRNIKAKTSETAQENDAILAVNGDFYGFRDDGAVLRNSVLYRSTVRSGDITEALVIDTDGGFSIIDETLFDVASADLSSVWQILSFGPALVNGGEICVDDGLEVSVKNNTTLNPRTAIGMIEPLHYVFVVADGRSQESAGLTLTQLAAVMDSLGCEVAYNLDGGGSSAMYFAGKLINNPTTNGRKISERAVSDIVYIGY